MDNLGRSHVNRCIETLASLASFNARFARRRQLLPAPILTMRNFLDIALRYEDHDVAAALLDGLEATLEAGGEDPVFLPNQHEALATLMWTKEALSESGSAWAPERQRLDDLHHRFGLVYFITSSKEGEATFTIEHPLAGQELTLPIVPNDSVPEASALLEPAFAHYARQWHRFAVPDPEETDARGFFLEARFLPGPIALPEKKTELDELATRYLSDTTRRFFGKMLPVPALSHELGFGPYSGNAPDYLTPPDVCGIELLDSSGSNEGDGKEG